MYHPGEWPPSNHGLRDQIDALEDELKARQSDLAVAERALVDFRARLAVVQHDLLDLRATNAVLRQSEEDLLAENAKLKTQIKCLRGEARARPVVEADAPLRQLRKM